MAIEIKYGKPIFHIALKTLRTISIIACILNVIIIIYCLELFNAAVDIKRRFGDYIDLMSNTGYLFPLYISCSGLIALPANLFIAFALYLTIVGIHKSIYTFLLASIYLSGILIICHLILIGCSLSTGYTEDENIHDGITSAIENYSTDGLLKTQIDRLQIEFQCCGSKTYKDWYNVEWFDTNFIQKQDTEVKGETPFSCCSIRSVMPCIHHGIESGAGAYKYTEEANLSINIKGCHIVVHEKKKIVGWNVTAYISSMIVFQMLAIIPLRFSQTAHSEKGNFQKDNHIYTSWFIGWVDKNPKPVISGVVRDKSSKPPPIPPIPPELMR